MGLEDSIVVGYLAGTLPYGIILLKGKVELFFIALLAGVIPLFLGIVPIVGTIFAVAASVRLAKPNSWWARHRYPGEKMAASRDRFPDAVSRPATGTAIAGGVLLVVLPAAAIAGHILSLST